MSHSSILMCLCRPWYYGAASGADKDVIVLIDVSSSMAQTYDGGTAPTTKLAVAINTANTIVETLTPNDRVLTNSNIFIPFLAFLQI